MIGGLGRGREGSAILRCCDHRRFRRDRKRCGCICHVDAGRGGLLELEVDMPECAVRICIAMAGVDVEFLGEGARFKLCRGECHGDISRVCGGRIGICGRISDIDIVLPAEAIIRIAGKLGRELQYNVRGVSIGKRHCESGVVLANALIRRRHRSIGKLDGGRERLLSAVPDGNLEVVAHHRCSASRIEILRERAYDNRRIIRRLAHACNREVGVCFRILDCHSAHRDIGGGGALVAIRRRQIHGICGAAGDGDHILIRRPHIEGLVAVCCGSIEHETAGGLDILENARPYTFIFIPGAVADGGFIEFYRLDVKPAILERPIRGTRVVVIIGALNIVDMRIDIFKVSHRGAVQLID